MTKDEAFRFLILLGMERVQLYADAKQAATHEAVTIRLQEAAEIVRAELGISNGTHQG
jgi:hypothetical protein